ncbi:hypothetical protein QNA08_01345 [Chelatococcus sp. SYSU_G07232]|uniref:Uncharacterized protein n=1 Tax=Chelatococcus albus TaxID=3047466 RepID=A0ABT7ABZ5_9HYPH|nr:hypothetical protein [Chelatococcus sp. SYSU_G07232]MDJ1156888.1 hypothetical protein [Chelatococcus sp. SYSU_G07232]
MPKRSASPRDEHLPQGLVAGGLAFEVVAAAAEGTVTPPEWVQLTPRGRVTARDGRVFVYVVGNGAGFDLGRRTEAEQRAVGRLRWPVAVLPDGLAARLQTPARVIALSVEDAAKMRAKHPLERRHFDEIDALLADYDDATVAANGKLVVTGRVDGRLRRLVVKLTSAGELLLNSYHFRRD